MTDEERARLSAELRELGAELAERRANLPAHSIRPYQLLLIEELEERMQAIARRLAAADTAGPGGGR